MEMNSNSNPKTLEEVFAALKWERKFRGLPQGDIVQVFRHDDVDEAVRYLNRNQEETARVVRAAFLGSDSLGAAIWIVEEKWEPVA